jgi:hypothetical protein
MNVVMNVDQFMMAQSLFQNHPMEWQMTKGCEVRFDGNVILE